MASATIIAVIKSRPANCVSPCAFAQKKRVSSVVAGMAELSKHTSRLFLLDRKSGQKFLIDSGSEILCHPPSPTMNKSPQSNFSLFAANNTKFQPMVWSVKELNLGLRRPFIWTFIIADVSSPIIGADFLKTLQPLIDLKKKLVDVETSLFTSCVFSNIVQPSILTVDANISLKTSYRISRPQQPFFNFQISITWHSPPYYYYWPTSHCQPRGLPKLNCMMQ
ncbi:uncharacterized protein TNCV_1225951 [Trichonephila clavipes]|nr:uncharacterized protein TNCV_1225951 [Trichonephila clavipes]